MSETSKSLCAWIRKQLKSKPERFDLRHLAVGAKVGQDIDSYSAEGAGADFADETASAICAAAEADANGIGDGVQTYVALAVRDDKTLSRFSFRVAAARDAVEGYQSEPATSAGVTAMLMRHLEARERMFAASVGTMVQTVQKMAVQLADENESLRSHRMETIQTVEELLSLRQERELEAKRADAKIEVMRDAAKELKTLAPVVLARLGGKTSPTSSSTDPRIDSLRRFYESLAPEQLGKLAETLTPAQQIALAEMFREPDTN